MRMMGKKMRKEGFGSKKKREKGKKKNMIIDFPIIHLKGAMILFSFITLASVIPDNFGVLYFYPIIHENMFFGAK